MKAPRRGVPSPPRLELSGSEPSHEPQSRSVNTPEKATPTQRATSQAITTAAKPSLFVEGMRKEVSADTSDGALLQPGMPAEGEGMVAVEEPAAVAAVGERPKATATTKRATARTAALGWTCANTAETGARGSSQDAARKIFSATRAIVLAVMNAFNERGGRQCSDSARMHAGER